MRKIPTSRSRSRAEHCVRSTGTSSATPQYGFFSGFRADFGIFGVGGIDQDGTLLDFHSDEVQARQAIVANCRAALLVADASKFGRNATVRGGHLGDCHHFFTDKPLPAGFRSIAEQYADRIHTADNGRVDAA